MKKKSISILTLALIVALAVFTGLAFAEPMDIPEGAKCHVCGMKVDPASVYSAEAVQDGELLSFCDIGDMLYYYNKQDKKPSELYVRDHESGKWTDATKATYAKSAEFETPMGWGIAAFADSEDCTTKFGTAMTFEEALGSLGGMKMKGKMKGKM
jgi:copper chaperone NosL